MSMAPEAEAQSHPQGRRRRFPWRWLASIGSGVLLAICYAPWDFGGLVWFALVPLTSAILLHGELENHRRARPVLLGYLAGLIFFTSTFHWLSALATLFKAPALLGLPLLLAAYLALYPAVWCWFLSRLVAGPLCVRHFGHSGANLAAGAVAASAWVVLEWVRSWLLSGFGWNTLAVALHRDLPMLQLASVTGSFGLSWLVVFVNVMCVIVVRRIVGELGPGFLRRVRWEFTTTVCAVVVVFSLGVRHLFAAQAATGGTELQVAAVQPNIPQEQTYNRERDDRNWATIERLTQMAAGMNPDLIVWPEASAARGLFSDQATFDRFEALRSRTPCPMLVGTVEDTLIDGAPKTFNSALLFPAGPEPLKEIPLSYRKIHLVPFGEYLPLRFLLNPIAGGLVPGDMDAGTHHTVFTLPKQVMGAALICFEDTVPELARRSVQNGATALFNLTNDSWFLQTPGAEMHLANAVLRAVENRRPLIRCGNTGVTAAVDPEGRISRWLEPHREGFAMRTVSIRPTPPTFYTRWGDWVAWLSLFHVGVAIALGIAQRRQLAPGGPGIPHAS